MFEILSTEQLSFPPARKARWEGFSVGFVEMI